MLAWTTRLSERLGHAVFIDSSLQDPTLFWEVAQALKLPAKRTAQKTLDNAFRSSGGWKHAPEWKAILAFTRTLEEGSPLIRAASDSGEWRSSLAMALYGDEAVAAFGDGLFAVVAPQKRMRFGRLGV